jgi:hypothetical protein
MPALAALSLKNQAGTEVVYSPGGINAATNVVTYIGAGASYDARTQVSFSVVLPRGNATRVRIRGKISVPIMDPVDTTKRVDECIGDFEFSLPKRAALLDRQNLRASLADFLTDATVVAAVENYESVY